MHLQQVPNLLQRLIFFCSILFLSSCLKDDFSKLSDSEWNPDLAFPLVNSTLTAADILANDASPTAFGIGSFGEVEIIYSSTEESKSAEELITLPPVNSINNFGPQASLITAFNNSATLGTTLVDSVTFSLPYSLDASLGTSSILDTVFLKSGKLRLDIASQIPHACTITIEIPELRISNQLFRQVIDVNYSGTLPVTASIERDLTGAYLLPGASSEALNVKYKIEASRSNNQNFPSGNSLTSNLRFEQEAFSKLSGYFGNYSAPIPNEDTLFLYIFRNIINASNLNFNNPSARIQVSNSTGMPIQYHQTAFSAARPGATIPSVDISSIPNPTVLPAIGHSALNPVEQEFNFSNASGSNIMQVINQFPRYMLSRGNYSFPTSAGVGYFLRDTSRVRLYTEVTLPLNGLTLDLQVKDTLDFSFNSISGDIEEILLRLNITNGFPTDGRLQVYFCKQLNGNTLSVIDSLYTQGTEAVLLPGQTGSNGTVSTPVQKITDALINRQKWLNISQQQADRLLIKAQLSTYDLGQLAVKILEKDQLQIRIASRIKVRKTF